MKTRNAANLLLPPVMLSLAVLIAVVAGGCPAPQPEEKVDPPPVAPLPVAPLPVAPSDRTEPDVPLHDDSTPAAATDEVAPPADEAPGASPETPSAEEPSAEDAPMGEEADAGEGPAEPATQYGGKKGADIDFVARNGAIFVDWPKPTAVLVFSGMQHGYIEPCGCAGLENMKGGVSRRHTLLKRLAERGWPLAAFDLGGLVRRYGRQAELKYHATTDALLKMDYAAVGFGIDDLRLPTEVLISTIPPGEEPHFVSANVGLYGFDSGMTRSFNVVQVGNKKVAVTSVLGEKLRGELRSDEIVTQSAAEALPPVLKQMEAAEPDLRVLLVNGTPEEATALARQFPQFDVVASQGVADPPPMDAEKVEGTETRRVELSHKGMYVGVLAFFDDERQPVRYQRVPLDGRFEDSPAMHQVMVNYQDQLKALGWEGLGIKPLPDPGGREFIGSQTCAECHTSAHDTWADTPHAHAWDTLVKLNPPRVHDPECVSCHVTGWEPQRYVPFASGFRSEKETPELVAQGCENCHGGGKEHALIELGELDADIARQEAARLAMRMTLSTEEGKQAALSNCMQCHDLDNSPSFDFETYWPKVEHEGVD